MFDDRPGLSENQRTWLSVAGLFINFCFGMFWLLIF